MPKVGLLIFPFWTPHFGWTQRLNYTVTDRQTETEVSIKDKLQGHKTN